MLGTWDWGEQGAEPAERTARIVGRRGIDHFHTMMRRRRGALRYSEDTTKLGGASDRFGAQFNWILKNLLDILVTFLLGFPDPGTCRLCTV